jgi:peptide/nickel transport system substrate-binding protein
MKKLVLALAALIVAASAYAQPFVWPSAWTTATPDQVVRGGTFRSYMIGDPRTFNPITSAESQALSDHIFNGGLLITRGPDSDEWVPYAAESFTVAEDGRSVDVVLREGLVWSDGTPVTVDDYYTTYLLQIDPEVGSNGHDSWFIGDDQITLEITGERSLRFHFPRPDRMALPIVALAPTPTWIFREAYESGGPEAVQALWGTDVDLSTTVWVSAFIPVSFTPGERVVLQANPTFGQWNVDEAGNPLPYLDGYTLTIADLDAALNLFLAGETDYFAPRNLDDIGVINVAIDNGDIDAVVLESVAPVASSQFIVFNWNMASNPQLEAVFRNVNFRRAMAHLLDRDTMIELLMNGAGIPMYTNVYPINSYWVNDNVNKYPYDPERAAQLLAEIGFTRKNANGVLVNDQGFPLSFTLATNAGNTTREQMTQIFADSAREIGVDVQLTPIDFNLLVEQLTSSGDDRPWQAILIGLTGGSRDWPFGVNVVPCGTNLHMYNTSGDCIAPQETLMTELFYRGRSTLDTEAAREIGYEIQQIESELVPILYTATQLSHYAWNADLRGVHQDGQINALVGAMELPLIFFAY